MSTHVLPLGKHAPLDPEQYTEHHVPPRWTKKPNTTLIKRRKHHEAYHTLLGAPATRKEAIRKLVADWWTDDDGNIID